MPKSRKRRKPGRPAPPPPLTKAQKGPSPRWYVITMAVLLGAGVLTIVLNYLLLLPGSPSNLYLFGGLLGIAVGFAMTTGYR